MKNKGLLGAALLSVAIVFGMTACGSGDNTSSQTDSSKDVAASVESSSAEESSSVKESTSTEESSSTGESSTTEKKETVKTYGEKLLEADKDLPEMLSVNGQSTGASDLFAYLAVYEYEKVDDYYFAYAASGSAEEVAIIRLKDAGDASSLKTALEKHKKTRIEQFKQYDSSQVPMAESAEIYADGEYVLYLACKNRDAVKKAFKELMG